MRRACTLARAVRNPWVILSLSLLVGLVTTVPSSNHAWAQEFPSREIRLIVPYSPGGAVDMGTRLFADKVEKILGVPVVVVNNNAGGGAVGTLSVMQAKPDGYMLLATTTGLLVLKPMLVPDLAYRYTDFIPISRTYDIPAALWVKNDSPWKDVKELIDYGKKNPGKLRASGGPAGSFLSVLLSMFKTEAGIDLAVIPTTGGTTQSAALMGGHVELCMDPIASSVNFLRAGRVRALASTHRIKEFPEIQTFAEVGLPGVSLKEWHGIYGPKGLPKEVVTKLAKAFEKASTDPSLLEQMGKLHILPAYQDSEETSKTLKSVQESIYNSLKQAGLIK
jgi:tripartite-type tricarboxylate transporter receptor subunit TctC